MKGIVGLIYSFHGHLLSTYPVSCTALAVEIEEGKKQFPLSRSWFFVQRALEAPWEDRRQELTTRCSERACGGRLAAVGRVTTNGGLDRQWQRDRKKWIHSRDLEGNMYNSR